MRKSESEATDEGVAHYVPSYGRLVYPNDAHHNFVTWSVWFYGDFTEVVLDGKIALRAALKAKKDV